MKANLNNDWQDILKTEFEKDYYKQLMQFLDDEYMTQEIFPSRENIYSALQLTSYKDTRVLILGQDPYHGHNQAHGLCFSVQPGVKIPPSLMNIYKELKSDLDCDIPSHGYLTSWAEQGVLMINTVLTVRSGQANSHKNKGWEKFTDHIITLLNEKSTPVVFILWGNNAHSKIKMITNPIHQIIKSPHPSPLSSYRGFFGSKPFSMTNDFLESTYSTPIDWCIKPL